MPLEADLDQVSSVVSDEFEGTSEANGCTRSLGGMEAPGALVEARVPSVSVPVCVYTSVFKCVLRRTHSGSVRACAKAPSCVAMSETTSVSAPPCMSETPSVVETPCVSGVVVSVPECVLPSTPCVKEAPQAEEAACAAETARVCEQPCGGEARSVSETPRVSAPAGVSGVVCVSEA